MKSRKSSSDVVARDSRGDYHQGHCFRCGAQLRLTELASEPKHRLACPRCHFVHYENPKILVGCIVTSFRKLLLCQRARDPSRGMWALPAGFLECHESLQAGAARELKEEAGLDVDPLALVPHSISSLVDINEVYVLFRMDIGNCVLAPGSESLAAAFFSHHEIPWSNLAFQGAREFIEIVFDEVARDKFSVHVDTIQGNIPASRAFPLSSVNRSDCR